MRYWLILAAVITAIIILLACCGCQERLTKQQWETRYVPADVNAAMAKVAYEKGMKLATQKAKSASRIDWAIFLCLVGAIGCGAAIVLGTTSMKSMGISGLFVCIGSAALLRFYQDFPLWFSYLGGGIALFAGSFAIWKHRGALYQVVRNVEGIKRYSIKDSTRSDLSASINNNLEIQSKATKKLVARIRDKINGGKRN